MYKAIVFDLDGTVCDTLETIAYYCNKTLERYGLSTFDKERYKYFAGNGAKVLVERMLKQNDIEDKEFCEKFLKTYKDDYETDSLYKTKVFDTMTETLDTLKKMGLKIGLVSNKPNGAVRDVVEKLFKENTFDFYSGLKDDMQPKPNPSTVLYAMEQFGIEPSEGIYVGDTNVDMQTGKNAKMYTVGVLWGFRDFEELRQNGADCIIKKPAELIEIAKR